MQTKLLDVFPELRDMSRAERADFLARQLPRVLDRAIARHLEGEQL
ncbi:MAG TPA: hypothetical protein VM327_02970 [Candidatus Thermoplasmatota archaeon]|nr:hypothetical protein [Candidatus Thermoplasmatota archaeon]